MSPLDGRRSSGRQTIVLDRIHGAPDLMIEVLSPYPRVGRIEERLAWFARYGVRECWLVHLLDTVLEVVRFDEGRIASRRMFGAAHPIESVVLPAFERTLDDMLD